MHYGGRVRLQRLGNVASINSSIMLLLGDADVAAHWRGMNNGASDGAPAGSDWDRCYQALDDEDFAPVLVGDGALWAVSINQGGLVNVVAVDEGIALVELAYVANEVAEARLNEDMFQIPDFAGWVAGPFGGDAIEAGRITIRSGVLAIVESTSSGETIPVLRDALPPDGAMEFPTLDDSGVLVGLPPGEYVVSFERPVKRAWGGACRALIAPVVSDRSC